MISKNDQNIEALPRVKGFRLRGLESTRLDTFIDAAFAFATTILVISFGNIPKDFSQLLIALKGIPSFLASFVSIIFIWLGHRQWSRRYGIEDNITIFLSLSLVFILMIYVYPLRIIFSSLFAWLSQSYFPSEFELTSPTELADLFIFYGLGFSLISLLMGSLFLRSYNQRNFIQLDTQEIFLTKYEVANWFVLSIVALVSVLFAAIMPISIGVYAGFIYFTLPILMPAVSIILRKRMK